MKKIIGGLNLVCPKCGEIYNFIGITVGVSREELYATKGGVELTVEELMNNVSVIEQCPKCKEIQMRRLPIHEIPP